jgi:acyl carrier protein
MSPEDIVIAIKDIIKTIAPDEDVSNLALDVRLREQIELDSMDFLDIVMELRKLYGVQVPEEDYKELATLAGCMRYLHPMLADKALHCAANA